MQRVVTPRIASVLEERHTRLDDDMQMARQATDEAENLRWRLKRNLPRPVPKQATRHAPLAEAQAKRKRKQRRRQTHFNASR